MSVTPPTPPAPIEAWEVLDLLAGLVEKSLVVYEEDEQGRGRYRLLETVRQYGRDRLLEAGEGLAVRDRHREFHLEWAEGAAPHLRGSEQQEWLDRLEVEHDNLRAAVAWALDTDAEAVVRFVAALWPFCQRRSHHGEWERWLAAVRPAPGQPIRIRRAAMGSYLANVNNQIAIRVRRIQ